MYKISFKVRIPYNKIKELRSAFNGEPSLNAKVIRPPHAPQRRTDIVEIRVTANTQGSSHAGLIEKTIEFNDGTISDRLDHGTDPWHVRFSDFFKKIGLITILTYAGIVGTTISFYPAILQDPTNLSFLIIISIPTSIGIGSGRLMK